MRSAYREVVEKSERQIERDTARRWLLRALACWRRYRETRAASWKVRAHGYEQEAREHAALAGEPELAAVNRALRAAARVLHV